MQCIFLADRGVTSPLENHFVVFRTAATAASSALLIHDLLTATALVVHDVARLRLQEEDYFPSEPSTSSVALSENTDEAAVESAILQAPIRRTVSHHATLSRQKSKSPEDRTTFHQLCFSSGS